MSKLTSVARTRRARGELLARAAGHPVIRFFFFFAEALPYSFSWNAPCRQPRIFVEWKVSAPVRGARKSSLYS